MHLLQTRRGLLMGFVVLALVAAACGSKAAANEGGSGAAAVEGLPPRARPRPDRIHRRQRYNGGGGYGGGGSGYGGGGSGYTGGGGGMAAITVMEGLGNTFTFSPSTITVKQGDTVKLDNVSDTPHTFTVTGQSIDVETQPGKTAQVTIDLPPGTYPFVCRFHGSMGMTGTLVVR
jgi:plastocyanin